MIVPMTEQDRVRADVRAVLLARLRAEPVTNIGRWSRDELYGAGVRWSRWTRTFSLNRSQQRHRDESDG